MRCDIFFVAIASCAITASGASGDTPQPEVILGRGARSLVVGPHMDASNLKLYDTKLVGQDLTGAKFDGAELRRAWIEDCEMNDASFRHADLRGATIVDCRIEGADFTDALITNITAYQAPMRLTEKQLTSTASYKRKDLSQCVINNLRDLDLRGFDLSGSTITCSEGTRLGAARVQGAKITILGNDARQEVRKTLDFQSGIVDCDVRYSRNADLTGITFVGSRLTIPDVEDPKFRVSLRNAVFHDCSILFIGSSAAKLLPTTRSFKQRQFTHNYIRRTSDLSHMNLNGMNLLGCYFNGCDLTGSTFDDAIIDFVVFRETKGLTEAQIKSTWNYRNNRMRWVTLPKHLEHLKEPASDE
jgi:uncharacterized protein YjbI with pentapeptide repeats